MAVDQKRTTLPTARRGADQLALVDALLCDAVRDAAARLPFTNAPGSDERQRALGLLVASLSGILADSFPLFAAALEAAVFAKATTSSLTKANGLPPAGGGVPIRREDLERVHREMQIAVPLDQASPLLLATLAVVAHCWLSRAKPQPSGPSPAPRKVRSPGRHSAAADRKRLAANDID